MKVLQFILTSISLWGCIHTAIAQPYDLKGKQATPYHYAFTLVDEFEMCVVDLLKDTKEYVEPIDKEETIEYFMRLMYQKVTKALAEKTGLDILPKETLQGKIIYLNGYPFGTKKMAAQKGTTPYYLNISVRLLAITNTNESRQEQQRNTKTKVQPSIHILTTLMSQNDQTVFRTAGEAYEDWIILDPERSEVEQRLITSDGQKIENVVLPLIDKAIENLKRKLP